MSHFFEPVVLKEDSSLEKEYDLLKGFSKISSNERFMKEKGIFGEKQVLYYLKKSNIGMYILRDVNFKYADLKAQVDFVVITSHHCYFIECKNYSADIVRVDKQGNFETSTKYKNRYQKKGIPSPLSQVNDQLTVFKRICLCDKENTSKLLNGQKFDDFFQTIVVFTDLEKRLDVTNAPNSIKYKVLKVDNLIRQIDYMEKHSNTKAFSQEQMLLVANYILSNNQEVVIDSSKYTEKIQKNENNYRMPLAVKIFIVFLVMSFIYIIYVAYTFYQDYYGIKPIPLSDNQTKAISIIKSANYASQKDGFAIVHSSVCAALSSIVNNKIDCTAHPIEVKISENNDFYLYKPKTKQCYKISFKDEKTVSKITMISYNQNEECHGNPIGVVKWDNNDSYYLKMGGYNELNRIMTYSYINRKLDDSFFDYNNIEQKGGLYQSASLYRIYVDAYLSAITQDEFVSIILDDNSFSKFVKEYYYIMK